MIPLLGCDNTKFAEFESALVSATADTEHPVTKLGISRIFEPTAATPWSSVAAKIGAGYKVCVSWKPVGNVCANVLAGNEDARIAANASYLHSIHPGPGCYASIFHEPESGANAVADYKAMFAYVYPRFKALAPNWAFGPILSVNDLCSPEGLPTTFSFNSLFPNVHTRTAMDYFTPGVGDFVGLDFYAYRGDVSGSISGLWADPLNPPVDQGYFDPAFGTPLGTSTHNPNAPGPSADPSKLQYWVDWVEANVDIHRFIICEMAFYVVNPGAPYPPANYAADGYTVQASAIDERRVGFQNFADTLRGNSKWDAFMVYERDEADQGGIYGNGRISGGVLAAEPAALRAFASVADVPTPPSLVGGAASSYSENGLRSGGTRLVSFGMRTGALMRNSQMRAPAGILPIGEIHQTLPSLIQSAQATTGATVAGGIVQTLPSLTQAATAVVGMAGPITQTLPSLVQSAEADVIVQGPITQTLPSLIQSVEGSTGDEMSGAIVQVLPSLTQVLTAVASMGGPITQTLPSLIQAATAVRSDHAVITQTLPSLRQAATGITSIGGPITQTLPSLTQAATGIAPMEALGVINQTLPSLRQFAFGFSGNDGTGTGGAFTRARVLVGVGSSDAEIPEE